MSNDQPLVPSRADEPAATLQERFQQYGYLYFPRHVASGKCDALMAEVLDCLAPHVVQDHSRGLPVLRGEPFFETDAIWDEVYPKIQSLYDFHHFFHEEDIQQLMRILVGEQVFVYPMKMGRIATPRKLGYETPPHQDAHSHQAGNTMAGIWVALHDIFESMGRVKVLPGSHKSGVRKVFTAEGVGGVQCEIYPEESTWHVSDSERGDVLIFHSATVHKAEPNLTESTVRMSVDTRFCDYGAPVFSTNLEPHHGWRIEGLDWDFVYRNWQAADNQYYWKDYPHLF